MELIKQQQQNKTKKKPHEIFCSNASVASVCLFAVLQLPTLIKCFCALSELWTPSNFECMQSNEICFQGKSELITNIFTKNRFSSPKTQGKVYFRVDRMKYTAHHLFLVCLTYTRRVCVYDCHFQRWELSFFSNVTVCF